LMQQVKCYLVTGNPGARGDFLAGWLGTLPNFVNSNWAINPRTGISSGSQRITKILDKNLNLTLQQCLEQHDIVLSADANLAFAGSVHGFAFGRIGNKQLPWRNYKKIFQILYIQVPDHDLDLMNTIRWEHFCKNYFSMEFNWAEITGDATVDVAELAAAEFSKFHELANFRVPRSTIVEYTKLFVPGGSRYLCETLNIIANDNNHQAWDLALLKAISPYEITCFGKTWTKADYISAINA
jgi:hypothetical protein